MNALSIYDKENFPKQVRFDTPSKSDPRLQSYNSDPRLHSFSDSREYSHPFSNSRQQTLPYSDSRQPVNQYNNTQQRRYSDPREHCYPSFRQQSVSRSRSNSDADSPCPRPAAHQKLHLSTDKLAYNYENKANIKKNTTSGNISTNVFNNYYAKEQNIQNPTKSPNLSQVSDDIPYNIGFRPQENRLDNNYTNKPSSNSTKLTLKKQQILSTKDLHHPAPSNELDLSIFDSDNGAAFKNKLNVVSKPQTLTNMDDENGDHENVTEYICEYNEIPYPFPPQKNTPELGSPSIDRTDELLANESRTYLTQATRPDTPDKTTDFFLKPGQDIKNPVTIPNLRRDNELVLKSKMEIAKVPTILRDHTNLLPASNLHNMKQSYPCNFTNMRPSCRTKENIYPMQYRVGPHNNCNCTPNVHNCQVYRSTPVQNQQYHLCCNTRDRHQCHIPSTPSCSATKNSRDNTVALKSKAIEQRERQQKTITSEDIDKELSLKKSEKEEPTVSDLCQIIKLQNEQLQRLQERVDKLVTLNENQVKPITCDTIFPPTKQTNQEVMTVETINDNIQKISIGVMTSFEMVRTSHSIIKGHNIQHIQCSQSQISVTKVGDPVNFLDGITRCNKNTDLVEDKETHSKGRGSAYEKTLNDLSLYPIQIEEVKSPDVSPETSLHLDVQDYSDSDEGNSNVGWTYYNQVMNHVNEILGSSPDTCNTPNKSPSLPKPPLSAARLAFGAAKPPLSSAKSPFAAVKPAVASRLTGAANTSVSTSKRVTFGDCHEDSPQEMVPRGASTETSMQMNRLAQKYLRAPAEPQNHNNDMSLATRQYMHQHRLMQGASPELVGKFPNKILDITALKQQPKLL